MSNLSDFFPGAGGGGDSGTDINLIMVGGGGGAGNFNGSGAGGYFYGSVPITPGVSYPVVIGTGGSPGDPASCYTPAGLGNPGSPSRFSRYEALGGGGGATICGSCAVPGTYIPGSPGGTAGGITEAENSCFGPVGQCISPINTTFYSSGAAQRTFSPNGYCGALVGRDKSNCGLTGINAFNCCLSGTQLLRRFTGTVVCPEFFGVCLASIPYQYSPAPAIPQLTNALVVQSYRAGGCSRTTCCVCVPWLNANVICNCPNTGSGAFSTSCNGDSGVVLVAYPCTLPAATSFPGAVDCSPVSIPQNGYRTYKFTSSGSFTL